VARVFQRTLAALAARTEVFVYALNPCRELWEEGGPGPVPPAGPDDPFGLLRDGENEPLQRWGRPGRENIRLLKGLSDLEPEERFVDPLEDGKTLLTQLQHDILAREPPPSLDGAAFDLDRDGSLRILPCPDVRREAEIIAAEIWRLVREDDARGPKAPLRFPDIAVIFPHSRKELYQTHLAAAFRESHDLPHHLVDLPLGGASRLPEAVALLLALPLGSFRRPELLRLMTHPNVLARFPEVSREAWLRLADDLGIFHGADREDHRGTYLERDLFNWDQGVRRLVLGAFMAGRRSGGSGIFELGGEHYLPEERPPDEAPGAAAFGLLARSLIADARWARSARLPLGQWIAFLRTLVTSYLVPVDDDDLRVLRRIAQALEDLAKVELGDLAVSYRVACELAQAALSGLEGSRGQYLADGVVVSSFLPMRAIPFRVIFVAGLGEGGFPAAERQDRLDLRLVRRQAGDVSPRERDCYLFLETLLCARERLYLSYVARDPVTGDRLEPSSVVVELREILGRGYVPREALADDATRRPRLRRDEDSRTCDASAPAAREAWARLCGESLRQHLGEPQARLDLGRLRAELETPLWEAIAARLGLCPVPPPSPGTGAETQAIALPISRIRRFLECPLQGFASAVLGLREDEEEDVAALEDEPFGASPLERTMILREVFVEAARAAGSSFDLAALAAAYDRAATPRELAGKLPAGIFGRSERGRHLEVLGAWRDQVRAKTGRERPRLRVLRWGRAEEGAVVDEILPPLVVEVSVPGPGGREHRLRVEIGGRSEPILEDLPGSLLLTTRREVSPEGGRQLALRAFLDHVLLSAAGRGTAARHRVLVTCGDPAGKPVELAFAPLSAARARAYLETLLGDLYSGAHDYLLPFEAVLHQRKDPSRRLAEIVEGLLAGRHSCAHGPIRDPERFEAPDEEAARAMVAARLGLFFETLVQG
jgi:exodeoxyribonuclease V gamma subunit